MKRIILSLSFVLAVFINVFGQVQTISKEVYRDKTLAMIIGTCGGVVTGYEYLKVYNTPNGYYAPGAAMKEPMEPLLGLPDDWFILLNGTLGGTTKDEFNYFSNFQEGKIFSDDDQHVDFFNQHILDKFGPSVSYEDLKAEWIHHDLRDFGGTADALNLIKTKDLIAPQMGMGEHGNNGNWLPECYIEHETMGAAFPGMPNRTAEFTKKFSSMSGQGDPLLWGQYWAATHSIAYFETDARVVIQKALGVLPQNCRPRQMYDIVVSLYKKYPTDWRAAVKDLWANHARYPFAVGPDKIMLLSDVNNGTALLSVLYGENDYLKTLKIVSLAGGDGDCSAATLCGMLGIIKGMAGTPKEFVDRIYKGGKGIWINDLAHALHMHNDFQINWTFDQLTDLYQRNAERMIRAFGGNVSSAGYTIKPEIANLPSVSIPNWDFEDGNLNGWKTWKSGGNSAIWAERQCNANTKSCYAASGEYKATINTESNTSEAKVYQTITGLKPGGTYLIEGRIHTASGREARLYVENYGGAYKYTSIYKGLSAFPVRYLYVKLGATNTSMDVGLHAPATDNGSKWCSLDDVIIREVTSLDVPVRYEAETAKINKGIVYSSTLASGGKYIGGLDADDSYIEFNNVSAKYKGEYLVRINYANGGDARSMHRLTVNGKDLGNAEYPDTGPWGTFSENILEAFVRLNPGINTIRLRKSSLSAEIDYIEVLSPYGAEGKPADNTGLISGGIYKIVAKHSNKVMDVKDGNIANGSLVVQNTFTGAESQYFTITDRTAGVYSITPMKNNTKGVEVLGATINNTDNTGLWDYWGGDNQLWALLDVGDGYFKIINDKSGKAMDVAGLSLNDGVNVFQYDYLGGDNQKWRFDFIGMTADGLPHLIPGTIQAEEFKSSLGVQTEATTDAGGGQSVAFIENGDWLEYQVTAAMNANYVFNFRVSSATTGGNIVVKSNGSVLATVAIAGTGGWQTWKTVTKQIPLIEGVQTLRLEFTGGTGSLFNINWTDVQYPKDCNGTENGTATIDACGECTGGTTGKATLDTDKDGMADCIDTDDDNDGVADASDCEPKNALVKGPQTWYEDLDNDGFGDALKSKSSCTQPAGYVADLSDKCPADKSKKDPGNCGCGKTENSCLDCFGIPNGKAYLDYCSKCVGGLTQKEACVQDCNMEWGGTASYDICNTCSGGKTNKIPITDPTLCTVTNVVNGSSETITIYPNPFSDELIINGASGALIEVFSISGVKLMEVENNNSKISPDVMAGTYILRITKDGKTSSRLVTKF